MAQDRLEQRTDAKLEPSFKKPWRDGTRALVLEPHDLRTRASIAAGCPANDGNAPAMRSLGLVWGDLEVELARWQQAPTPVVQHGHEVRLSAGSGGDHRRFRTLANRRGRNHIRRRSGQQLAPHPPPGCILQPPVQLPETKLLLRFALVVLVCALLAWLALLLFDPARKEDTPARRTAQAGYPRSAPLPPTARPTTRTPPQAESGSVSDVGAITMPYRPPRYRTSGPGKIRCGDLDCSTSDQFCCHVEHDKFCVDRHDGCPDAGWDFACDETADCAPGLRCCFEKLPLGRQQARCSSDCSRPDRQLCAHDNECESQKCNLEAGCELPSRGRMKLPGKR